MVEAFTAPTIHSRGNKRLDGVIDFVAFAAKPMPLVTLLDEAPRRVAAIFESDVCSLYLVEGDGHELVMRGNVGFSPAAIGQVRLQIGEGMTGEAVEYLRPVSSNHAPEDAAYKYFDVLSEERYPVFVAVPIRGKAGPLGALVIQRASGPFQSADIELLLTMGAVIAAGIRHAELIDARRDRQPASTRQNGTGTRKVTLTGRPLHTGRALGALAALRRPTTRKGGSRADVSLREIREERKLLRGAFDVADKALRGLVERAGDLGLGSEAGFLSTYLEIVDDGRFRERADELLGERTGIAAALGRVAREVTRTAAAVTRDAFAEDRARDIEDLCDALVMLATSDRRALLPSKAIVAADAISVFDVLISARSQPVGIALTGRHIGPRTHALLRLLGVPAIVGVEGLFRWASDGDVLLLDADHGLVIINPSKAEVAAVRAHKEANALLAVQASSVTHLGD